MYIFAKGILGGRGETQNNFVHGELGRTSLKSRQTVNVIRYLFNTKAIFLNRLTYFFLSKC